MNKISILMGSIAALLACNVASAQPYGNDNRRGDSNNAYGQTERNNDYGRQDQNRYDRQQNDQRRGDNQYRQGAYEQNCRGGNQAAGTIFGALAGGLIGSAASHGNGGAVVGGAVLGGLLGNTISRDISCDSQPYAFRTYSTGLNGQIGRRYDWNHGQERGYFIPTREYRRSGSVCRDFRETTYRDGREYTRSGTSCRSRDGNWQFD